jgi:hypothetical protein
MIELHRDPEMAWVLLAPVGGAADAGVVEQAISWLANPIPSRVIDPEGNFLQYGLSQPKTRIIVRLEEGETHEILVGNKTPTGNTTYIQLAGHPNVYVVNKFSLDAVLNLVADDLIVTPTAQPEPTGMVEPEQTETVQP